MKKLNATGILIFVLVLGAALGFAGCGNGTTSGTGGDNSGGSGNQDYVTVWPTPLEKRLNVPEGPITVALLATGKYCDLYYDKNLPRPSESELRQLVFNYDNSYAEVTSFLGLYEKGGGPGGNGGGDSNPRIQTYIYDLYPAGGRFTYGQEEGVFIDITSIRGSTFTHELCHVIFYGNHYAQPDTWYHELLPIMSDVVFHGAAIDWTRPNVELFGVWNNDGGSGSWAYYNTYTKLAAFLVDKYGDTVLHELFHQSSVNKQALESLLADKGQSLSALEAEFTDWCDNFGNPADSETRIIAINDVTLSGLAGVWLTSGLPEGNNPPTNTAIQSGEISDNKIAFSLVVPNDNTWNNGPAWLGSGDYYVYIVPIVDQSYRWANAFVYTGGTNTPSKVTFNKAVTRLSFNNFRRR